MQRSLLDVSSPTSRVNCPQIFPAAFPSVPSGISRSHFPASRTACVLISGAGSVSDFATISAVREFSPSKVCSAWSLDGAVLPSCAIFSNALTIDLSCFSTSNRWAVSRHQPFSADKCWTSSMGFILSSRGAGFLRFNLASRILQILP